MVDSSLNKFLRLIANAAGWLLYLSVLGFLLALLPNDIFTPESQNFIFIIGALGIWRYSIGFIHFFRGMVFLYLVFPYYRRKADLLCADSDPSHAYLMITSFRVDTATTALVYEATIREAIECGWRTTVVCSIVEVADEMLIRALWDKYNPPTRVNLMFVRIPGTGKRDGLAYGFRAISRDLPDDSAVVAVIDGDTILAPGMMKKTVPYFRLLPNVGAVTTNEVCELKASYVMSQWHKLRFAQRHINMSSMALSHRVLTLTGRMSLFRASVVTSADFIADIEHDQLDHWRLGQFKFLTGDDKSSWFSLVRRGFDTWYVPDAIIKTIEHPPHSNFFKASRMLMFRWSGNSLRQNNRATWLGPDKLGWFPYYVLWDQRVSMWTSLVGLTAAVFAGIKYSFAFFFLYIVWIVLTRLVLAVLLRASGHMIGPLFPVLLYYNQIMGAIMKIYVNARLDRQSWTRQRTVSDKSTQNFHQKLNPWTSRAVTFSSVSMFLAFVYVLI